MSNRIKVYMGIPSTGTRVEGQLYALREIEERYRDKVELVYPDQCAFRLFHDFARCDIVEEFLASGCDALWFLDSDIVPPKHVLELITQHWDKWQCAGAAYPIFMPVPGGDPSDAVVQFTAYKGLVKEGDRKGIMLSEVPSKGTAFLDGLATGCLFIKREVFALLEKPYFEFKYDKESRKMIEGEDLGFCIKVNKLGIKFFTDFSMLCSHYKNVNLLQVNNYAIDHSNNRIQSYDKEIRGLVASLDKRCKDAFEKGKQAGIKEATQKFKPSSLIELPKLNLSPNGIILPTSN